MRLPGWVDRYVGIPYREKGRDRAGCDCWGLAWLIWTEQLGLPVSSHATVYGEGEAAPALEGAFRTGIAAEEWLQVDQERAFDGVLMKGYTPGEGGRLTVAAMHVGVVLSPGVLIHVEVGTDAVWASYRTDPRLKRRVLEFWRHRDLVAR